VAIITLAVVASALLFAEPSAADRIVDGPLIVNWRPEVAPQRRPQITPVPSTFRLAFESKSRDTAETPQLSGFAIEILKPLVIDPTGLRPCPRGAIFAPDIPETACDRSLVGHGSITSEISVGPEQPPSLVRGVFRAFYSDKAFFPGEGDHPGIVAVVRARVPAPTMFVIPFTLEKARGAAAGTRLFTTTGHIPQRWLRISAFNISLHRVFVDEKGRRRSFVSATCPSPPGFAESLFPFLVGTVTYANGEELRVHDNSTHCTIAH
jgi:hypothetical protein